jgi:hypothetical protein
MRRADSNYGTFIKIEFLEVAKFKIIFFVRNPDFIRKGCLPLVVQD